MLAEGTPRAPRPRAPSTTLAPVARAPDRAPDRAACGAPASQRAGNAAAQARAGIAGAFGPVVAGLDGALPTVAAGLDGTLAGLGEMASVVLDALPLPQALRLAWGRRDEGWARAWIEARPPGAVLGAAPEVVRAGLDSAWPVGLGVAVGGMLGGAVGFVSAELAEEVAAERGEDGVHVRLRMSGKAALAAGLGAKLTGAGDAGMLGADAEAKLAAAPSVTVEWDLDEAALLDTLLVRAPAALVDVVCGRATAAALAAVAVRGLDGLAPSAVRVANAGEVDLGAEGAAAAVAGVGAKGHAEVGGAIGVEGGRAYVEAHLGGSAGGEWATWLFAALRPFGVPPAVGLAAGVEATVRAVGTAEAIAALREGEPARGVCFEASITCSTGDRATTDILSTPDPATLAGWIRGLLDPERAPAGAASGGAPSAAGRSGAPVPAAELPDLALTRGVERAVGDLADLDALAPSVAAEVARAAAGIVEPLDAAGDRGLVDLDVDATLAGSVRVPVEAVRAALGGAPLPPGEAGIEARVLDVARIVAAEAVGGSAPVADLPRLDLEAAAPHVERDGVELLVRAEARAGLGGEVAAGLLTGAKADGGVRLTWRERLASLPRAEQARLLGV